MTSSTSLVSMDVDFLEEAYKDLVSKLPSVPLNDGMASKSSYDIISSEADATKFTRLIERYPDLSSILQDPANDALSMYISPHYLTTEGLLHMPNVPVLLTPVRCNGPQILHTSFNPSGWTLNRTTRFTRCNIIAANGVVHYVDRLLRTPPDMISVLDLNQELKILRDAIRITGLESTFLASGIKGRTLFAPSNSAFQALGEDLLKYLFEREGGRPYLETLTRLHFAPNVTFFSNLIWPKNNTGARQTSTDTPRVIKGRQAQFLDTSLTSNGSARISVGLARFNGLIAMQINGSSNVLVKDVASNDGVLHLIDRVLVPAREDALDYRDGELTVEMLKDRLVDHMR